jgi:hypothetical protein
VAAKKKSQKKRKPPATGKQAKAILDDVIKAVEQLDVDLHRIKSKVDCLGYPSGGFYCPKKKKKT